MIYVARADGKVIGKFSEQEFRAKISAGDISPNDQYLGDGTRQWIRASEFPGATFPKPDPREQVLPGTAWPPSAKVCTNCGYVGNPISITRGDFAIEVLLWLFFLVPGIIYSVWRLASRYAACPKCKAPNTIPVGSPVAQRLRTLHGGRRNRHKIAQLIQPINRVPSTFPLTPGSLSR